MVFCTVVIFRGTGGASKLSAFRLRENFMKVHGLTGHNFKNKGSKRGSKECVGSENRVLRFR